MRLTGLEIRYLCCVLLFVNTLVVPHLKVTNTSQGYIHRYKNLKLI
jgi:hypothetical protein